MCVVSEICISWAIEENIMSYISKKDIAKLVGIVLFDLTATPAVCKFVLKNDLGVRKV
jgi:hypothetical protein